MKKEGQQLQELIARARTLLDSDPVEARSLAECARELATAAENRLAIAWCHFIIGTCCIVDGAYDVAESELRSGLDIAQELGDDGLTIRILRGLLKCAFYTRNSEAALLRGMQALQLARESGDRHSEATTHNDLGLVYGNLGDFEGSLEHLLAGLRIMRELDAPRLGSLLNNIGNVYLELQDHREALNCFRKALEAFRADGAWRGEAIALGNKGRAYSALDQHARALSAYESSRRIYEEHEDLTYLPPALARTATALAGLGREEEARAAFEKAFDILSTSAHHEFDDEVLFAAGKFHLDYGDVDRAIDLIEKALALLPPDETTRRTYELHRALSEAHEKRGDPVSALKSFKNFYRIRQAVSDSAITVRIRGLMLQFDVERARQQEEIFRLRNVELAQANEELHQLHAQLEAKNRELHRISIEDSLTRLHNRRYLELQFGVEISRARRHGRPLCTAMCDIDHFKEVNDRFSHAVGDEVLRRIARLLQQSARVTDIVARYGGEEFLLVLPETDQAGAEAFTERLRIMVAEQPWDELAEGLQVTLSIGVAELDDTMDASKLIAAADARLYEAKRSGRNRVVA